MTVIPRTFRAATIAREGDAGREWLRALPKMIEDLAARWDLTIDGPPMHGYLALVLPVSRGSDKYVLKVSWIDSYSEHEALALQAWDGNGAVRIFESDVARGAMLLERLDSSKTLESLSPDAALEQAGSLLRRLSIKAPPWARSVSEEVDILLEEVPVFWEKNGRPFVYEYVDKSLRLLEGLRKQNRNLLVNHDLHYQNVLAGTREPWLVIDPKVLAGDPEYAITTLLWQEFSPVKSKADLEKKLSILVDSAELDVERARQWVYARSVSNCLWLINEGLTEDAKRCWKLAEFI